MEREKFILWMVRRQFECKRYITKFLKYVTFSNLQDDLIEILIKLTLYNIY